MKFNEPSISLLDLKEIQGLQDNEKHTFLQRDNKQVQLYRDVMEYNLSNHDNFYNFYCYYHPDECSTYKSNLPNNLNVRRSRLNRDLKSINLNVDKNYKLNKINTASMEYMQHTLISLIGHRYVKSVRIFDSFIDNANEPIKEKLLSNQLYNFLKKLLVHKDRNLEIISVFENENTINFYKNILKFYGKSKKVSNLSMDYINKPLASIIYALITDDDDNNYIFYYEKVTEWSAVTEVTKDLHFSEKFWQLLEQRFEHYSSDETLKSCNEIIPVTLDLFKNDFFDSTENLIFNIKELLNSYINANETNKNTQKIKDEINKLTNDLIKIKIAFPKSKKGYDLLYHHMKLAETLLLLKTDINELTNTREIIEQIYESDLTTQICKGIENEVKTDKFLIKENHLKSLNIKNLQKQFIIEQYFDDQSFSDIYYTYNFNTDKQILLSLNTIISNKDETYKIINYLIKDSDHLEEQDILLKLDEKYIKVIFRAMLEALYNIRFNSNVLLSLGEIEYLKELNFNHKEIEQVINRIISLEEV